MLIDVVVFVLALVQSIFGVGLLLFGTPILILLGLPFREALWVLLPASITVSVLQLLLDRGLSCDSVKTLLMWTVPSVGGGLLLSLSIKLKIDALIIGILIFCALLRLSTSMRAWLTIRCHNYRWGMLLVIGFIHGLTNMGGSLLSVYAASQSEEKFAIRQYVALGYAFFSATQLVVLIVTEPSHAYPNPLAYMLISGVTFVGIGRFVFVQINHPRYVFFLNIFMLGCAALLIGKNLVLG